jgi:hypothetical protein
LVTISGCGGDSSSFDEFQAPDYKYFVFYPFTDCNVSWADPNGSTHIERVPLRESSHFGCIWHRLPEDGHDCVYFDGNSTCEAIGFCEIYNHSSLVSSGTESPVCGTK